MKRYLLILFMGLLGGIEVIGAGAAGEGADEGKPPLSQMQKCHNGYGYNISHFPGDEEIINEILSHENPQVLEIGPGQGSFLEKLFCAACDRKKSLTVTICELSGDHKASIRDMFEKHEFPSSIKLQSSRSGDVREFYAIANRSNAFTHVLARNSLHFLPPHNLVWVFDQIYASLVPGGMVHIVMSSPGMFDNAEALLARCPPGTTREDLRQGLIKSAGVDIDHPPYEQMTEDLKKACLWTSFQQLEQGQDHTQRLRDSLLKVVMSRENRTLQLADVEQKTMQKFTEEHLRDILTAWGYENVKCSRTPVDLEIDPANFNWEKTSHFTIGNAYKPTEEQIKARDLDSMAEKMRVVRLDLYRRQAERVWGDIQKNFPKSTLPVPPAWSNTAEKWQAEAEARKASGGAKKDTSSAPLTPPKK